MTVFKTFWKILNKNKFMVIMYTVILLVFAVLFILLANVVTRKKRKIG